LSPGRSIPAAAATLLVEITTAIKSAVDLSMHKHLSRMIRIKLYKGEINGAVLVEGAIAKTLLRLTIPITIATSIFL